MVVVHSHYGLFMPSLSPHLPWSLAATKWSSQLNPVLANPILQGQLLPELVVKSGNNTINHGLGRALVGYIVVGNSAAVTFYDKQATNQRPDLTLILVASGAATINIYVF